MHFSRGSPNPGIESRSPALKADSLLAELPGKTKNTDMGSLSLLRGTSQPSNKTGAFCIAGGFFTSWATRKLLLGASVQFSSVTQSCPTLCHPMNRSTPGLPVNHHLPEFTETHVHRVSDAIQPSHPLSSPFPPVLNPSQHHSLFQWVKSLHEVAKVLEFQL